MLILGVQKRDCPARAGTGASNAYTKHDIENSFPGTQMFVQARNYECPQKCVILQYSRVQSILRKIHPSRICCVFISNELGK